LHRLAVDSRHATPSPLCSAVPFAGADGRLHSGLRRAKKLQLAIWSDFSEPECE
jgi:hypothetical protein